MGLSDVRLVMAGSFVYHATDPVTDRVEHEFDHVLVGRHDADPAPDPAEVAEWRWSELPCLRGVPRHGTAPGDEQHAPWLAEVVRVACEHWHRDAEETIAVRRQHTPRAAPTHGGDA
jgi:isopentenyl-diphosphate delta-isomerase